MILTAIVATTCMTFFSVLLSVLTGEQFNEPFIIALLFGRMGMNELTNFQLVAGYFAHFVIGFLFVWAFVAILRRIKWQPTVKVGASYGFIIGLVGILSWMAMIAVHPDPPAISFGAFYAQLLGAHIVFGIAAALTYRRLTVVKEG